MTSDAKRNSRRRNAGAQAALAIEKLLERIAQDAESDEPGTTPQVVDDLRGLIDSVRRQYRVLADRQVQAALEAALAVQPEDEAPSELVAGQHDALEALEALIHDASESSNPAVPAVEEPAEPVAEVPEQQLFEGTIRLQVYPGGSMQRVLRFVDDIGKRPQFRLLRMSGNPQREGAEIDLGLREPLPLLETLWDMGHSAEPVLGKGDGVPVIAVHLYAAEVAKR